MIGKTIENIGEGDDTTGPNINANFLFLKEIKKKKTEKVVLILIL